jgi:hypothetical protein
MSHKLLGDSIQIKEINETIKQVAPTDVSILITGESGVFLTPVRVSCFSRDSDDKLIN